MAYELRIHQSARKELSKAPAEVRPRLLDALQELQLDPVTARPGLDCRKLAGRGQAWRVRVGAWRIIYVVHAEARVVELLRVGRKPAVYR